MRNADENVTIVLIMNKNSADSYQKELNTNPEFRISHFEFIDHIYNPESGSQYYMWAADSTESLFIKFIYNFVYTQPLEDYKLFVYSYPDSSYQLGTYTENLSADKNCPSMY